MRNAFIFIGPSGSGKGTQAKNVQEYIESAGSSVFYVQTGAQFRQFVKREGYTHRRSRKLLEEGARQPDFLAVHLWANLLAGNYAGEPTLLFDGTPRSQPEAEIADTVFPFYDIEIVYVVSMNVSREWATEHLLARGRGDDTPEDIAARLDWFESDVRPALGYYKKHPRYVFAEINGEQTREEVFQEILKKTIER